MPWDDEALIRRYLAGDPGAVAAVDDWILRAAASYRRRLGSAWDDALQSVRLEITSLLQRGSFRGQSSLKTYVWRIAGHTCLDVIRAQTRAAIRNAGPVDDMEIPTTASPLNDYARKETAALLLRVLDQMSEECRSLWRMILDGLGYQEMSRTLGLTEGNLRVKVLRCRRKAVEVRDRLLEARVAVTPSEDGRL